MDNKINYPSPVYHSYDVIGRSLFNINENKKLNDNHTILEFMKALNNTKRRNKKYELNSVFKKC